MENLDVLKVRAFYKIIRKMESEIELGIQNDLVEVYFNAPIIEFQSGIENQLELSGYEFNYSNDRAWLIVNLR